MSVRDNHEITAIFLGCLAIYMVLVNISSPALRGVRWVAIAYASAALAIAYASAALAIAYASAALGIGLRARVPGNLCILFGNLLLVMLCIAYYWGVAQLLRRARINLWLLLFLLPTLFSQVYFLYFHPWVAPRSLTLLLVEAVQSAVLIQLLLRDGTARTRLPRYSLAFVFLCWAVFDLLQAGALSLRDPRPDLDYHQLINPRLLLSSALPAVLMCFGYLWLAMTHLEQELELQSHTDALTGLLNRRALDTAAAREIARARRRSTPLSLLLLDLDHFKSINDRHGHDGGDAALQVAAQSLTRNLRTVDLVARLGGEEFLALLPDADQHQAALTAERIRAELELLGRDYLSKSVPKSGSFGVTQLRPDDLSFQQLFNRADQALYQAKNNGRNRVVLL
jgi:diguanylate cyclase (GGDEF)-like protein